MENKEQFPLMFLIVNSEMVMNKEYFSAVSDFWLSKIRSLRQSDKELILGKMEEKKKQFIENEGHEYDNLEIQGINCGIDTCKSIVEETLK